MRISAADRKRVEAAIGAAEIRAGAEFVCVLAKSSSDHAFHALAWAAVLGFATPWVLLLATAWPFAHILLAQLVIFVIAFLILDTSAVRRLIVPRRLQRAAAHRAAAEQFVIRDLGATPTRRAVLLFVSNDEHYARVLADRGAEAAVAPGHWRGTVDLLVDEARRGGHADGFIAALEHCAEALSASRPLHADHDKAHPLPDRFIVIE